MVHKYDIIPDLAYYLHSLLAALDSIHLYLKGLQQPLGHGKIYRVVIYYQNSCAGSLEIIIIAR